jgi:hypothetical protein
MREPGWARKTLRYRLLRRLYRRGWPQDMPLIGLDPSGRRDSTVALQALIDANRAVRLPAVTRLKGTVELGDRKTISGTVAEEET